MADQISNDWKLRPGLQTSFIHLQGVGPATERKLWQRGLRTWDDLRAHEAGEKYARDLEISQERFASGDWKHFDRVLPGNEKWRAFGDFGDRALYVDIETDGGIEEDSITVIGCFDGSEAHTFVRGRDLENGKELIENHPLVVTFNGAQFDMPMIRRRFMYNLFNHVHVDLRFPLRKLGFRGGLKSIEQQLGIARPGETQGLGGWDAVRLWREWEDGREESLELLCAYNREDTRNMMPLMKKVYEELGGAMTGTASAPRPELRCALIAHGGADYERMLKLRHEILRKPIGLEISASELENEKRDLLLGCFVGERLAGCCVLTETAPREMRLRQMAVSAESQRAGIGRNLMQFAETVSRSRGTRRLFMHARKAAAGFYEKLGYKYCGLEFIEVTLPHVEMEKIF